MGHGIKRITNSLEQDNRRIFNYLWPDLEIVNHCRKNSLSKLSLQFIPVISREGEK